MDLTCLHHEVLTRDEDPLLGHSEIPSSPGSRFDDFLLDPIIGPPNARGSACRGCDSASGFSERNFSAAAP